LYRIWGEFQRLLEALLRRVPIGRSPLGLEEYRKQISQSARQLDDCAQALHEVRQRLSQRAESQQRLAQRYEDQARRHYRLQHRDLAEAAIRESLKDELRIKRWEQQVAQLERSVKALYARHGELAPDEIVDLQATLERTARQIRELQAQLESAGEWEDGEVSVIT
jgi:chromosome segregation ATPase